MTVALESNPANPIAEAGSPSSAADEALPVALQVQSSPAAPGSIAILQGGKASDLRRYGAQRRSVTCRTLSLKAATHASNPV